jgi:hypothetical protein
VLISQNSLTLLFRQNENIRQNENAGQTPFLTGLTGSDALQARNCACGNQLTTPEARSVGRCKPCRDRKNDIAANPEGNTAA